jgi:Tol biopolymer transport system component
MRRPGTTTLLVALTVAGALPAGGAATASAGSRTGRIAVLRETQRACGLAPCTDLFVMNGDGSGQRRLTTDGRGGSNDWTAPVWSPDGRRLAFIADVGCPISTSGSCSEIFVVNADGSGRRQLTHNLAEYNRYRPSWSPDGTRLAYVGNPLDASGQKTGSCPCGAFVVNADGSGVKMLAADSVDPVWSPNGKRIAFMSNRHGGITLTGEIYVMRADGTHQRNLSDDRAADTNPAWSPDSRKLLFTSIPSSGRNSRRGVFVMNANGSHRKRIARDPASTLTGNQPAGDWSPDGRRIVLGSGGAAPLAVVNAVGTRFVRLRVTGDSPTWSPDGRSIAYIGDDNGKFEVYTVRPNGSGRRRLTPNYMTDDALAWQPRPRRR